MPCANAIIIVLHANTYSIVHIETHWGIVREINPNILFGFENSLQQKIVGAGLHHELLCGLVNSM